MFVWNMRHLVLISRENRARENAFGWTGRLWHINAERTSFRNEFRSGMKVIPESCKQALSYIVIALIFLKLWNRKEKIPKKPGLNRVKGQKFRQTGMFFLLIELLKGRLWSFITNNPSFVVWQICHVHSRQVFAAGRHSLTCQSMVLTLQKHGKLKKVLHGRITQRTTHISPEKVRQ